MENVIAKIKNRIEQNERRIIALIDFMQSVKKDEYKKELRLEARLLRNQNIAFKETLEMIQFEADGQYSNNLNR